MLEECYVIPGDADKAARAMSMGANRAYLTRSLQPCRDRHCLSYLTLSFLSVMKSQYRVSSYSRQPSGVLQRLDRFMGKSSAESLLPALPNLVWIGHLLI